MHDELPAHGVVAALRAVLVTLALAGCAEQHREPASRALESVVGGERSPTGGREDAVLLLYTEVDGQELVCSASLVAPNLAITARHCVSYLARGLFSCTVQGELVSEDGAGLLGLHLPADGIELYDADTPRSEPLARGKQVLSTLSETICVNDLAYVVLDRELDLPVLPLRLDGRAERGEQVTLVGYGLDDAMSQTGELDFATQPRTRNDRLEIADVGPDADEDATSVPPRTILVEGQSGCLGDSGGPLIARDTGAVLGVYSLLGGYSCLAPDSQHLFGHVPVFNALTEEAFAAANAEPTPEPHVMAGAGRGGTGGRAQSYGGAEVGQGGANTASAGEAGASSVASSGGSGGTAGRTASEANDQAGNGGVEVIPLPKPTRRRSSSGCGVALGDQPRSLEFALAFAVALALRTRSRVCRRILPRVRGLPFEDGSSWTDGSAEC